MTSFGYSRVSSQEQNILGISIKAQTDRLLKEGILEKNIYVDGGKSGGVKEDDVEYKFLNDRIFMTTTDISHRPSFQKLISLLKEGDTLVYQKHDRISRNIVFMNNFIQYCERKGIILKCLDESMDRLTRSILVVISEEELHKTKSRNQSVKDYLWESGLSPNRCPYGFRKKDGVIIPNPTEVTLIRQIYTLHEAGKDITSISKELNIHYQRIKNILKNQEFYKGNITYKGIVKKGTHEKII